MATNEQRRVASATVLILGTAGHGKSLLANHLLGLNMKDEKSFTFQVSDTRGTTRESEIYTSKIEDFELTVIDTPGFFDNEKNISDRWIDVVKAFLLVGQSVDAIIITISSRKLDTASACLEDIQDCIEHLNLTRVIVIFTHLVDVSMETCEECYTRLNKQLKRGTFGLRCIFSDQHAREDVIQTKMKEIIKCIKDIKQQSVTPITKQSFKKYTREYFIHTLQRFPQKKLTYDDLYNSPIINMKVIEQIIPKHEIDNILLERSQSGCTLL